MDVRMDVLVSMYRMMSRGYHKLPPFVIDGIQAVGFLRCRTGHQTALKHSLCNTHFDFPEKAQAQLRYLMQYLPLLVQDFISLSLILSSSQVGSSQLGLCIVLIQLPSSFPRISSSYLAQALYIAIFAPDRTLKNVSSYSSEFTERPSLRS